MTPRARYSALASLMALALLAAPAGHAQSQKPSGKTAATAARKPAAPAKAPAAAAPAAPAQTAPPPAAAASASVQALAPRSADYIVAVVNSEPITNNEVRARAARTVEQLQAQGGAVPPREQLLHEVLERLISERIQVQLALESGIKVDDYAIDQAELSVAQQNDVSLQQLHRQLAQEGISVERFRRELRNQLLTLRIRERDVESRVKVSDADVDQFMQEQAQSAAPAAQAINLGHIFIEVPESASPQQVAERQARADEVAAKLKAGGDFATLAREYSDAPEGRTGGELGLRPEDRYPELFLDATAKTPVGAVVGPVRSPAGFHILKVIERSKNGLPTMAVQTHARHILLRVSANQTEAQAAAKLEELRQRIVHGQGSFESLAREYSQDGSSSQGGDLGWSYPGRYVPEFQQALDQLKPGEISPPVVTRFGVHLIELEGRREVKLTQREQRDLVRDAVRAKKLDEAYANWVREERARAYVEMREPPQ